MNLEIPKSRRVFVYLILVIAIVSILITILSNLSILLKVAISFLIYFISVIFLGVMGCFSSSIDKSKTFKKSTFTIIFVIISILSRIGADFLEKIASPEKEVDIITNLIYSLPMLLGVILAFLVDGKKISVKAYIFTIGLVLVLMLWWLLKLNDIGSLIGSYTGIFWFSFYMYKMMNIFFDTEDNQESNNNKF